MKTEEETPKEESVEAKKDDGWNDLSTTDNESNGGNLYPVLDHDNDRKHQDNQDFVLSI